MRDQFMNVVLNFINQRYSMNLPPDGLKWDTRIFKDGLIDSLGIYELLLKIESDLSIKLNIDRLVNNVPETLEDLYLLALQCDE